MPKPNTLSGLPEPYLVALAAELRENPRPLFSYVQAGEIDARIEGWKIVEDLEDIAGVRQCSECDDWLDEDDVDDKRLCVECRSWWAAADANGVPA